MLISPGAIYMPYPDFHRCARVLDWRTLEQMDSLIRRLLNPQMLPDVMLSTPYKVWGKFPDALRDYGNSLAKQFIARNPLENNEPYPYKVEDQEDYPLPFFVGHIMYHKQQKSALMQIDPKHYSQYWGPNELLMSKGVQ